MYGWTVTFYSFHVLLLRKELKVIAWYHIVNVYSARRQKLLRRERGLWQNLVANRKEMTQIKGHANAAH